MGVLLAMFGGLRLMSLVILLLRAKFQRNIG